MDGTRLKWFGQRRGRWQYDWWQDGPWVFERPEFGPDTRPYVHHEAGDRCRSAIGGHGSVCAQRVLVGDQMQLARPFKVHIGAVGALSAGISAGDHANVPPERHGIFLGVTRRCIRIVRVHFAALYEAIAGSEH